jgi:two-component system sensor histidine kinase UhpB
MKLRPVGLAELGLAKALEGLAAMLRNDHASTEVRLDISADVSRLDDTSALTLYRIVQEGLTNAFRHAGATQIDVAIVDADADGGPGGGTDAIRVTVRDNGTGLDEDGGGGFGLTGMRERVWALGGRLQIGNSGGGGVLLEAVVPVARK